MKKTGIFYGSSTGTTKDVAKRLGKMLDVDDADIHDVANSAPSAFGDYDNLVLGTSTWGTGDLQDDWYDFVDGASALDLKGKNIALFGCGDQTMSDSFCSAVGVLYKRMQPTGARFVGYFDADGYDYNHSEAEVDGKIVGLLLDEVNHPEMTDFRLRQWTGQIRDEFSR